MDNSERDALITRLHTEGWSTYAIAADPRVGLSQSRVQQIVTRWHSADEPEDDEDDYDEELAEDLEAWQRVQAEPEPVLPYDYRGMAEAVQTGQRVSNQPRVVDATGRYISELARWRYQTVLRGRGDPETLARLADSEDAIAEAIHAEGWRWVSVGGGRCDWRRVEEIERAGLKPPWQDLLDYNGIGPPPMSRPVEELLAEWDRENGIVRPQT